MSFVSLIADTHFCAFSAGDDIQSRIAPPHHCHLRATKRALTWCTSVHTIETDDCEWDIGKASDNLRKHGVRFSEAAVALLDPFAVTRQDPDSNGEARYLSLGMSPRARILVTVFSFRGDKARIISARKASLTERRLYRQR
jgi:uncharacterized DUF497 family protein